MGFAKIRDLIRDIRGHFPCQSFMDYSSVGTTVNSRECGVVLAAMTGDGTSKSKSRSFGGHECFCGLMKCYFRACATSWNAQMNDEKLVFGDQRLVGSCALSVEIMNCLNSGVSGSIADSRGTSQCKASGQPQTDHKTFATLFSLKNSGSNDMNSPLQTVINTFRFIAADGGIVGNFRYFAIDYWLGGRGCDGMLKTGLEL